MLKFKSWLKFFLKTRVTQPLQSFLLLMTTSPTNRKNWEKRLLVINLQGLGDLVAFTSVLKHYRQAFPNKEIYLLAKGSNHLEGVFEKTFVDKVITLNYRQLSLNPFYGYRLIKNLRGVGFETVVNHDFSAAEVLGKALSLKLGAKTVVGYEGMALEFLRPFDSQQKRNLRFFSKKILPQFTKVVPRIDYRYDLLEALPSALSHYIAIFESITSLRPTDYSTHLPSQFEFEAPKGEYAILNLNASVAYKRWPFDRFAKVAERIAKDKIDIVLTGSNSEQWVVNEFKKFYSGPIVDLVGKTSFEELIVLLKNSKLIVSGDTSLVHIGVALKKPTLCLCGGGQFGLFVDYGYRAINHWIYKRTPCFCDNWYCSRDLESQKSSPCLDVVTVEMVLEKLETLLQNLKQPLPSLQDESFRVSLSSSTKSGSRTTKIIFSGVQFENYNFKRISFEYSNFLLTLRAMPGLDVLFYPFDFAIQMGKREFNRQLLGLVEKEKPDLFFAFMYTDELKKNTLDKIQALTKSVAWFADDHWRLDSYSRFYASHFTKAVTTWSEGVKNYKRYGINNVIRSQWACNPLVWRPKPVPDQDIDVSFVGQYNSARGEIVRQLRALGVDVWVRGWGWPEGRLPGGDMIQAFSRSKINLNFNTPPNRWTPKFLARLFFKRSLNKIRPNWHILSNFRSWLQTAIPQIKARPFEVIGCRAFLISAFADDVDRYYADQKEIVYYRDLPDLAKKIRFYLDHPELREQIAEAGYKRTLREHTYPERFVEIFKHLGLPYNS